jgi:hypothetical protein
MAFPFDLLELLLPDIAHWLSGRSSTDRKRLARAGTVLLLTGMALALCCLVFETAMVWAFNSLALVWFTACLFAGCGLFLLACLWVDSRQRQETPSRRRPSSRF